MTALPLLFLAMTATSVLAEPTVYLREQFEDGGESFRPNHSLTVKTLVVNCQLHERVAKMVTMLFVAWWQCCSLCIYAVCIVFDQTLQLSI